MSAPVQPTASDRTLTAMRALVLSFFPSLKYYLMHEYSVAESDGLTFSGTPTDTTFSPSIPTRVPYSPSIAGSSCIVPVGTLAHVVFLNADPGKPRCIGFDLPSVPTSVTVDASGGVNVGPSSGATTGSPTTPKRLVREGDSYTATGTVPGVISLTLVSTTQPSGPTTAKG